MEKTMNKNWITINIEETNEDYNMTEFVQMYLNINQIQAVCDSYYRQEVCKIYVKSGGYYISNCKKEYIMQLINKSNVV